jgi:polyribonucleotide 5'-hydroxyl-kinase
MQDMNTTNNGAVISPPPLAASDTNVQRHLLLAEQELCVQVPFSKGSRCTITLQAGSCELHGAELAVNGKPLVLMDGGYQLSFFTWYGCTIDVCADDHPIVSYVVTDDDTAACCNIAYVNTHAQLEACRDEAFASNNSSDDNTNETNNNSNKKHGPRVLIVGPPECGKSTLAKTLVAYATKVGRTPLWVDLNPHNTLISVPGSLAVAPTSRESIRVESYASNVSCCCAAQLSSSSSSVLSLWHGSAAIVPALFQAQVKALGAKINKRLQHDEWEQSSGIIVDANGWMMENEGYDALLTTVVALKITVILVIGHDRLYSQLKAEFSDGANNGEEESVKVIKLPRSDGVVSRNAAFQRHVCSRAIKRYFYGDMIVDAAGSITKTGCTTTSTSLQPQRSVPQLTPFLMQIPFQDLTIYKFSSLTLSASLLPVAAAQATEAVQLTPVQIDEKVQHTLLACCHPHAVAAFEASGQAKDLYEAGVAGFCAVERVVMGTDMLHLLSPCAGSLPSRTLILGDITWME